MLDGWRDGSGRPVSRSGLRPSGADYKSTLLTLYLKLTTSSETARLLMGESAP